VTVLIGYQVQLKAKEPVGGGFAPLSYIFKHQVLVDAAVVTNP